ncbi:hypothetical protein [uncultured Ruminococcus sp.]|uniref:hypothetical protein n=1 Tax=uncultured Ruminococcus sp. TaxID=165186 RepID=UPI0025F6E08B|nr:hypothetical protein [uncultured Ruminococcus sp.]
MNFSGFDFDESVKAALSALDNHGRIPHAIIIESKNREAALEAAKFLSMYAVCTSDSKPCKTCEQCHKAEIKGHADISYPRPENKSKTYSIEQMRNIIKDSYILPNEANAKVYVFEEADNRLTDIAQNSFLKLLEEPPQNVYFILLCESAQKLLVTILSRCTVVRLKNEVRISEKALEYAEKIVKGIISSREYDLLLSLNVLSDKENADETLSTVRMILRDGLALSIGTKAVFNEKLGRELATRFTKGKIIEMIELTDNSAIKIKQNININLLTTWLCGEYRRISWQR